MNTYMKNGNATVSSKDKYKEKISSTEHQPTKLVTASQFRQFIYQNIII